MPTYAARLKKHLSNYKTIREGIHEDGIWRRNRKPYPHILPVQAFEKNILEDFRTDFWLYARGCGLTAKLHRDFHHLSSSQALAFNVFFPFFHNGARHSAQLLEAMGLPAKRVTGWGFELVPDLKEGTNFDFGAVFSDGTRLLVEVKLSETEFGRCADDLKHRGKLDSIYRPRLNGKVLSQALVAPMFFDEYQLLRNVSHIRTGDTLVLLVPRANSRVWQQAETFLSTVVRKEFASAVRLVALENLITSIRALSAATPLAGHADNLTAKYIVLLED